MIKKDGVKISPVRNAKVLLAKETLEIIKQQHYTSPQGKVIDLSLLLDFSINNTKLYSASYYYSNTNVLSLAKVEVTNEKTDEAAIRLLNNNIKDIVILNFASARNVGGGFLSGATAQEEDLCRASGLYACIKNKPVFYNENNLCKNKYYTDNINYSPNVPFFRDSNNVLLEEPFTVSVISAPAPNISAMKEVDEVLLDTTLGMRVAKILQVAHENKHKNLILGAWGCGAFGNDPEKVSVAFKKALIRYPHFENVCFAVYDNKNNFPLYSAFKETFK